MKINYNNLELFWYFISERHGIYKKRTLLNISPPWTDNQILSEYRFTNVFRDLDPGTRFVIEYIIPNCLNSEELLFNIIIYRLYNKIDTFLSAWKQNPYSFDRNELEEKIRNHVKKWNKAFTWAFIVSWYSFLKSEGDKIARISKIIQDISLLISNLVRDINKNKDSAFTFACIKNLVWIWDFLAYQICVDFWYAKPLLYNENEHVVAWPWCKRWLWWIFPDKWILSYEDLIFWLEKNQFSWFANMGIDLNNLFSDREDKKLNIMAIENCLCEFSKYMKALTLSWRPRNRFKSSGLINVKKD